MAEEMTIEQQQALAMAAARMRMAQAEAPPQPLVQPHTIGQKLGMGMGDVPQGFNQAAVHSGAGAMLDPMFQAQAQNTSGDLMRQAAPEVDQSLKQREQQWQQERAQTGDKGVEWLRGTGAALASAPIMAAMPAAAPGILPGMAMGAAQGGLSALTQPVTGGDYAAEKTKQLGIGTGMGGALGGVLGAFGGKKPQAAQATQAPQTQEQIKAAAQAAYKQSEQAGVIISPDSFKSFADSLPSQLKGYHPAVDEPTNKLIGMLQSEATNGPMTLEKLDALRSVASAKSVSRDLNDARLAGLITSKIDDYIDGVGAKDIAAGDANIAIDALKNARSLWRVNKKYETINDIVDTGEILNDQNWVKGRFRALVKSPQFDRFSADEQEAIGNIARTGNLEKAIKLIPWRGVQMASTYAEPMLQQQKISGLQGLIARGGMGQQRSPGFLSGQTIQSLGNAAGQAGQRTLPYLLPRAASGQVFGGGQ